MRATSTPLAFRVTATGYGVEVLNGGVPASAGYTSAAQGVSKLSATKAVKAPRLRR